MIDDAGKDGFSIYSGGGYDVAKAVPSDSAEAGRYEVSAIVPESDEALWAAVQARRHGELSNEVRLLTQLTIPGASMAYVYDRLAQLLSGLGRQEDALAVCGERHRALDVVGKERALERRTSLSS